MGQHGKTVENHGFLMFPVDFGPRNFTSPLNSITIYGHWPHRQSFNYMADYRGWNCLPPVEAPNYDLDAKQGKTFFSPEDSTEESKHSTAVYHSAELSLDTVVLFPFVLPML